MNTAAENISPEITSQGK